MPTPVEPAPVYLTLNPPYRLEDGDLTVVLRGWAEVDDPGAPAISLSLNGRETPLTVYDQAGIQRHFPGMKALGFQADVDFKALFAGLEPSEPFLLEATVVSDHRRRTFEYSVTPKWLEAVFGRPLRARRIPPEPLQIRVAGAAAGEFHRTGGVVADQIAAILQANGRPLRSHGRILDFGAGPGRVLDCIHDRHPAAQLSGSDIDPEAIAWASEQLADIADFHVNGAAPPLPFADESFDFVYAISVFTHLPREMQWGWLSDLRRVLKPGGLLLTTKLNHAAYDLPPEVKAAGAQEGFVYWGDAAATEGLPGFYRLAYHSHDYVRREWGRYFEVLHIGSHDLNGSQDAVLLRRPRHALSWLPAKTRRALHAWLPRRA